MVSARERIFARRALFVASLAAGCREAKVPSAPSKSAPAAPAPSSSAQLDEDHDGVPDDQDNCPGLSGTVAAQGCPAPCLSIIPATQIEIREKIYFAAKSAKLRPEAIQVLEAISAALKGFPELSIVVRGHVDPGEPEGLALERARTVRNWLIGDGIADTRLELKDLGATEPVDPANPAKTDEARARNRRVEFAVR